MGLCPFPDHKENSPSFSVSQDKQLYHCFGCGKSGNLYSFLRDYYGYSFTESVEYLAKRAGIPLPKVSQEERGKEDNRKELKAILSVALEQFVRNLKTLPENHEVLNYLKTRGFDESSVKHLKIGWAKDSWDEITNELRKRGLSLEKAAELGLVKKKRQGSGYYDGFRARVMFPVFSFSNEVVGFGGRVLGDEKPKYINSPESDVFKKGRIFYGQNWSSPYIRQENEVIVVEGYTDWISLFVSGVKNVLATMGTALTEEHGKRIKTWCSKVLCLFDGDDAGKNASERALKHLFKSGLMVRGVFLDQGEDPDSFVKKRSLEEVKETLSKAQDLFLQLLDQRLNDFQARPDQKIEALNWSTEILSQIPQGSPLLPLYVQELESRLILDKKVILEEILKAQRGQNSQFAKPSNSSTGGQKPPEPRKQVRINYKKNNPEYILFSLALSDSKLFNEAIAAKLVFSDPGTQFLWVLAKDKYGQAGQSFGRVESYLASFLSNPEALTLTMEKPYSHLDKEQKNEIFHECLHRVKNQKVSFESKKMSQNMGPTTDEKDLERFMELQRKKRNLIK
jgi:DNA primase